MNPNRDTTAITGLIIGCILFGLGSLIIVFVPLGSFAMSFWRLLIGSLVFAALAWRYRPARPKTRRTWLFAILAGIFLNLDLALWHESIRAVGPGISTLLNSLQIFFLAAIGLICFNERLTHWQSLSLLLAIGGVALIASPEFARNHHAAWGFASGTISGAMLAASMASIRKTHEHQPLPIITLMLILNIAGALTALPIALIAGENLLPRGLADISLGSVKRQRKT